MPNVPDAVATVSAVSPHLLRFWLPEGADLIAGEPLTLTDEPTVHYLLRVLRCRIGEQLLAIEPGAAHPWLAQVTDCQRSALTVTLVSPVVAMRLNPPYPITLAAALIKDDRWEWLLQKATELGVGMIQPLITARTTAATEAKPNKLARWHTILSGAALQSEGTHPPHLVQPLTLDAFANSPAMGPCLVLHERAKSVPSLLQWLNQNALNRDEPLTLIIGPEGGWSPDELATLQAAGAQGVSLGPRILRAETAALAALAQVMEFYPHA